MDWKKELLEKELAKDWESSINMMLKIIKLEDSVDAYLSTMYLLMNLLVEEQLEQEEYDRYCDLIKKIFNESRVKFSNIPEYLFFTGIIALMSEWYLDIDTENAHAMMRTSLELEPENIIYKWVDYCNLDMREPFNMKQVMQYSQRVLSDNKVKDKLLLMGSLGLYLLELFEWSAKPSSWSLAKD